MSKLSHVGEGGEARMVDVSGKAETARTARAEGEIRMSAEALSAIQRNAVSKGDVLAVARVAGVMAAKRTAELIPLCHPIPLTEVQVTFNLDEKLPGIRVRAETRTVGRTGVEMEAITAVSVALITIYDMAKALDKGMSITNICLTQKTGGRSGDWQRG